MPTDQKRASGSLELELQIVICLDWELNPGPLEKKLVVFTGESFPVPGHTLLKAY